MPYDPTDTRVAILVPMPHYVPRPRGIHARTKCSKLQIRMSVGEKDIVRAAGQHLGLASAEFTRWMAVFGAKEVLKNVPDPEVPTLSYVYDELEDSAEP
jgi:hypothetical protein